jgi:hypothetical protein
LTIFFAGELQRTRPILKIEGESGARAAYPLRIAGILHAGKGAAFELGKVELAWRPGALKSDTTSRRTPLQAVLSQSGSPFPYPDGGFDLQTDVPERRLVPSRSRPAWRDGVPDRETPGRRTGLQTAVAAIQDDGSPSRASWGSSEQRLGTASWNRARQAAVSIAGAAHRHPACPIGAVRRRIAVPLRRPPP